jgi:hypothetical protein
LDSFAHGSVNRESGRPLALLVCAVRLYAFKESFA